MLTRYASGKRSLIFALYHVSARSATGCVAHGLGFLPTTSLTRDDEARRIDGSVNEYHKSIIRRRTKSKKVCLTIYLVQPSATMTVSVNHVMSAN